MPPNLIDKLEAVARLANGSKWQRFLHTPYRYANSQLFLRTAYRQNKKGRLVMADTFFGQKMKLLLPAGMDIYLLGAKTHHSEIRLMGWMLRNIHPGSTVLDIGVHFGFYSLLAAHLVGSAGRVIGVEASRAMYEVALSNVADQPNVSLHHLAATDENTLLQFYEFPILYSEYNTLDPDQFAERPWISRNPPLAIEVTGQKADTLLEKCQVIPDFIKIDVEGAEYKVIRGLQSTLQNHAPIVAMEYLADQSANSPHHRAAELLASLGYQPHFILTNGKLEAIDDISLALQKQHITSDNFIFIK